MQLTGLGPDFKFKGSLISYSAEYSSRHAPNILPKLVITKSTFRENAFIGDQSSLIYVSEGQVSMSDNLF